MIIILILFLLICICISIFIKFNRKKKNPISYLPLDIAKYICSIYDINNIQLQKALLYLQVKYYKKYNYVLFDELFIKCGKYYVINSVYIYFCGFGAMSIYYKFSNIIPLDDDICKFICEELDIISNMDLNDFYKQVLQYNKKYLTIKDLKRIYK